MHYNISSPHAGVISKTFLQNERDCESKQQLTRLARQASPSSNPDICGGVSDSKLCKSSFNPSSQRSVSQALATELKLMTVGRS